LLSVFAIINDKIFCIHGGISPDSPHMSRKSSMTAKWSFRSKVCSATSRRATLTRLILQSELFFLKKTENKQQEMILN
jgi:hypothetical protein